jgi:hypothetical protein
MNHYTNRQNRQVRWWHYGVQTFNKLYTHWDTSGMIIRISNVSHEHSKIGVPGGSYGFS